MLRHAGRILNDFHRGSLPKVELIRRMRGAPLGQSAARLEVRDRMGSRGLALFCADFGGLWIQLLSLGYRCPHDEKDV